MSFISLFSPPRCPLCSRFAAHEDALLCGGCAALLEPVRRPLTGTHNVAALSLFAHRDLARRAIHSIKFGADSARARALGRLCGRIFRANAPHLRDVTLVPIPTTPRSFRQRGFNHAAIIAAGFSQETGWRLQSDLLRKRPDLTEQKRRNATERRALRDAFTMQGEPRTTTLVLIDDVLTSGATLAAACRCIQQRCEVQLSAATLCYTPRDSNGSNSAPDVLADAMREAMYQPEA